MDDSPSFGLSARNQSSTSIRSQSSYSRTEIELFDPVPSYEEALHLIPPLPRPPLPKQTVNLNAERNRLKSMGLGILGPAQHFAMAVCRDVSLIVILKQMYTMWGAYSELKMETSPRITATRSSEYLLAGLWCLVSGYMTYSILDGLMVRWIVTYSITAAIVRMLSMSLLLATIVELLSMTFNPSGNYYLPNWILISCVLTVIYILQNYMTSNLRLGNKKGPRSMDLYNIVVFAVVPIGVASFFTMIGLIRVVLILRLDVELLGY
ncbi:unnamed protein product [Kuraishia capsulata CBS 1993]|uniref:N-glycosylation protein EOS1 n=1 Tax=Kuraishia capsulata CBS 1993 TaxID=1382522 RepID=W6MJ88_9ASCO|nr:uncharacterized protein KUCA_T00001979001 [Kuraishia capsulata CBS 1993]CDK26008.1 unnamed protein product [Kuraishia capsulata CBS 1993]